MDIYIGKFIYACFNPRPYPSPSSFFNGGEDHRVSIINMLKALVDNAKFQNK